MSSLKRKHRVSEMFYGRIYRSHNFTLSPEEITWLNIPPVGREFGSPDYERLTQQDHSEWLANPDRFTK